MELHFVAPDLTKLDEPMAAEVVACCVYEDEMPMRGLAGLLDWRMAGKLSNLEREGFLRGEGGEVLCVPGRPRIPFDKVLLFGRGKRASFDDTAAAKALSRVTRVLEGLRVRRAVVELPGRGGEERISPERAAEILHDLTHGTSTQDAWWIVEGADGERRLIERTKETGRRPRR